MTFPDEATLAVMRADQARIMTDTVTIRRPDRIEWDGAAEVAVLGDLVYTGPGVVQSATALTVGQQLAGAQAVSLAALVVKVPWDVTGVRPDDIITVDICDTDPDLVGRRVVVEAAQGNGWSLTCRRILCRLNLE